MSQWWDAWMSVPRSRRRKLLLLLAALIFLGGILWAVRSVLWPYALGLALAYILAPIAGVIESGFRYLGEFRRLKFLNRVARLVSIIITYLLVIAILVGFFSIVVPMVIRQGKTLWDQRETVWKYISDFGRDVIAQYQLLPDPVKVRVEETIGRFSEMLGGIIQQAVEGTAVVISYTFSLVLAILIIPFWTFYLLLDSDEISSSLHRSVPDILREDVSKIVTLVDTVFSSYLRGQLFLGVIIGIISTIVFSIMGVNFSVLLGLIAGIFEMVPNIGPVLGAIPAILVALSQDPILALWVTVYAFAVQQVENLFISPQVIGETLKLHPVVVMVVLVIGSEISGLVGLFLAPVVTAALRDLFRYIYYRLGPNPLSPEGALRRVWTGELFDLRI